MKFFNKIRQNLLKENRLSRYLVYAFGEIVLVAIGILIALQINYWNEEKKRDGRIQIMLDLILGDLDVSIKVLDDQVLYFDKQLARIALILKVLDKSNLEERQLGEFEQRLGSSL